MDVTEKPLLAKRSLGYLPETLALYPEMRVREYVAFRAELCGVPGRDVKAFVDEALGKCFVDDVASSPIGNLSKGYRQRVGLAGALVHKPKVLVLDEPTVGLDPRQIVKVRELIRDLRKDHTILLSTHILPEAELVCDRILIIDKGRIVASGTPETLRHQMSQMPSVTVALKGEVPEADAVLRQLPGVSRASRIGAGRRDARHARRRVGHRPARIRLQGGRHARLDSPRAHAAPGFARGRLRAPRLA